MNLGNANLLFLVFLLPLLGLLAKLFVYKRKIRDLKTLGSSKVLGELIADFKGYKRRLKRQVYFMALWFLLLAVALLRPQYGWTWRENHKKGVDIAVAVDVSQSMLAKDVSPNRLQIAKRAITDLLNVVQGDRVSLVVFAGTAFIETPLTEDLATFKLFLNSLSTDIAPVQGTNFELAFEKSIEALTGGEVGESNNSRAIFMLTDGEELDGRWDKIKQRINELGIKIYILGIGTKDGAPIPFGHTNSYKRDQQGNIIISKLNGEFLENLAKATGGAYVPVMADSDAANTIYRRIKSTLHDIEFETNQARVWNEWYQLPLFLAVLMMLLFRGIGGVGKLLFALTYFCVGSAFAESADKLGHLAELQYKVGDFEAAGRIFEQALGLEPDNYKLNLGLGNSYYRQNKFTEAEQYFQKAAQAESAEQKADALYNLGNSLVQLGKYQEAVSAYQGSLQIAPNQKNVADNLEYAKKLLQAENQSESNQEEQQDNSTPQSQDANSGANQSSAVNSGADNSEGSASSGQEQSAENNTTGNNSSNGSQDNKQSVQDGSEAADNSSQAMSDEAEGGESSAENNQANEDLNFQSGEEMQDLKEQSAIAGEALLNALREDRAALKEFRRAEASKQLENYGNKLPNKDW
jgi:Ca-activated chloride channel family protein